MLEILKFIFSSFRVWLGTFLLVAVVCSLASEALQAIARIFTRSRS